MGGAMGLGRVDLILGCRMEKLNFTVVKKRYLKGVVLLWVKLKINKHLHRFFIIQYKFSLKRSTLWKTTV